MALSSQLSRFKAPGTKILTDVVDSTPETPAPDGARLLVISSRKGPVNHHPILVQNYTEYKKMFDDINDAEERRGNWSARSAQFMLDQGPIYVLNIRKFDDSVDLAGLVELSGATSVVNGTVESVPYTSLYSTAQFWKADPKQLVKSNNTTKLLVFGNLGSSSLSIIVRKTRSTQSTLTFEQWYSNLGREMPSYVNPFDKVADSMVDVIIFNNNFNSSSANNANYGYCFNSDGTIKLNVVNQSNEQVDAVSQLTTIPESGYMDTITGSLVQNFKDAYGNTLDIVQLINNRIQEFGLLAKLNDSVIDTAGAWVEGASNVSNGKKKPTPIDLVGHSLCNITANGSFDKDAYVALDDVDSLSYNYAVSANDALGFSTDDIETIDNITAGSTLVEHTALFKGAISGTDVVVDSYNKIVVPEQLRPNINDKYVAQNGNLASVTNVSYLGQIDSVNIYEVTFDQNLVANSELGQSTAPDFSAVTNDAATTITLDDSSTYTVYNNSLSVFRIMTSDQNAGSWKVFNLTSYTPRSAQFLDGTYDRQNDVLDTLINTNLKHALANKELIQFNYVVDAFKSYIEPNCKYQLREVAETRILARAICNMPAIYDFIRSTNPYFSQTVGGTFDAKYIASGGNTQLPHSKIFSLPNVDGWYAYYFGPNINLSDGKSMPPAALVSNVFARKYTSSKPYAILAGTDGIITGRGVSGVEYVFNERNDGTGDRDYLDPFGYNVILTKSNVLQIYGNKTANTTVENPMMSIHTSEVIMYIQQRINALLERFVFKYNNAQNRLIIKEEADSICNEPLGDGAISDFTNQMDTLNNTGEVIANRIGILDTTIYDNSGMEILVHRTKVDTITNSATFEILPAQ